MPMKGMRMKRVALFLTHEQIRKAKKVGREQDRSLAGVVRRALDRYFKLLEEQGFKL